MIGLEKEITTRRNLRIRLVAENILVGIAAGLMITLYRWLIPKVGGIFHHIYHWGRTSIWTAVAVLLILSVIGAIVGIMTQFEPKIGGSGIPQVAGQLRGRLKMDWRRILPLKFLGGILVLGSGLTVGREGPSIQMGASVGQAVGELLKRPASERKFLISGGAAAGLSAAFNAPLSGLIFALEEVHHNFSSMALISAMSASLTAGYVAAAFLGYHPVLNFGPMPHIPFHIYGLLVLLAIVVGLSGWVFTHGIALGKTFYARLPLPTWLKVVISFVASGLVVLLDTSFFGSGEEFIFLPIESNTTISHLFWLYIANFGLLLIAFCSGLPGGIFFPMLVLGSLLGNLFGEIGVELGILSPDLVLVFAVLAMCAHFSSVVRSPITGVVLIIELTGSFSFLLPVGIVGLLAYLTAEAIKLEPVYEMLLDFQLHPGKLLEKKGYGKKSRDIEVNPNPKSASLHDLSKGGRKLDSNIIGEESPGPSPLILGKTGYAQSGILMEYPIYMNSRADGRLIRELDWPNNLLLICVRRGGEDLLPRGHVRLYGGDYLIAMHRLDETKEIEEEMAFITQNPVD